MVTNTLQRMGLSYSYESLEVQKTKDTKDFYQNKEKSFYKSDPANKATVAYVIYAAPEVLTGKRYFYNIINNKYINNIIYIK